MRAASKGRPGAGRRPLARHPPGDRNLADIQDFRWAMVKKSLLAVTAVIQQVDEGLTAGVHDKGFQAFLFRYIRQHAQFTNAAGCAKLGYLFHEVIVDVEDVRCGRRNNKVLMCRPNGTTRCISSGQVNSKLTKGWTIGECSINNVASNRTLTKEWSSSNEILVYPTLFEDKINIELGNELSLTVEVSIYDLNGRILISKRLQQENNIKPSSIVLNTLQLESGYYIMSITNEFGLLKTEKIIKL